MTFTCPACGFDQLDFEPWEGDHPADEICPCCGIQFGYDDLEPVTRTAVHRAWGENWREGGSRWWSTSRTPPAGWAPPPHPTRGSAGELLLDWRLDPGWSRADQDWVRATDTTFRYDAFPGSFILRIGDVSFDADWGWIPLLDLGLGLRQISQELRESGPGHEAVLDFTENDAELRFERGVDHATITATYADGVAVVPLAVLLPAADSFLDRLCRTLGDAHPSLWENAWFSSLTYRSDPASVEFLRALVLGFAGAEEVLRDHVEFFDEILPHLLMSDLLRWLIDELEGPSGAEVASEIMQRIEDGFAHGPASVDNLIAVSFFEMLPRRDEVGFAVREFLGPASRSHVEKWSL